MAAWAGPFVNDIFEYRPRGSNSYMRHIPRHSGEPIRTYSLTFVAYYKATLVEQIEDNRWMVRFEDGPYTERLGDFRVKSDSPVNLVRGARFLTKELGPHAEVTVANYCGMLVVRPLLEGSGPG